MLLCKGGKPLFVHLNVSLNRTHLHESEVVQILSMNFQFLSSICEVTKHALLPAVCPACRSIDVFYYSRIKSAVAPSRNNFFTKRECIHVPHMQIAMATKDPKSKKISKLSSSCLCSTCSMRQKIQTRTCAG